MANNEHFTETFAALRAILQPYASHFRVDFDNAEGYSLSAPYVAQLRKELFFGAVQKKKNYVSFYLMPVYVFPELLENISPALKKRMQGKSCFNFKQVDLELFQELAQLTVSGYEAYKQAYQWQKGQ